MMFSEFEAAVDRAAAQSWDERRTAFNSILQGIVEALLDGDADFLVRAPAVLRRLEHLLYDRGVVRPDIDVFIRQMRYASALIWKQVRTHMIEGERMMSPIPGHFCLPRNREHFPPCGCTCEGCDREPQPGDGPEYDADHAAWESRVRRNPNPREVTERR